MRTIFGVILAVIIVASAVVGIISDRVSTAKDMGIIRSDKNITAALIGISTDSGMMYIPLKAQPVLDSLSQALRASTEVDVPKGGSFDLWADVEIHKGSCSVLFRVQFSPYNGKYLTIGNRTFNCPYLISLVDYYGRQSASALKK